MASSLPRISTRSRSLGSLSRPFSAATGALVEAEVKQAEIGMVSGIPDEHLRRRVVMYSPARTATQQGSGKVGKGKINFVSTQKWENPLMGWTSTRDPYSHVGNSAKPLNRSLCTATASVSETRTQKLERIASELLDLNKLERHDYAVLFRHKMGLHRYGPAVSGQVLSGPAASGASSSDAKPAAAEKTAFDIKLEKFDATAKIKIIKEVRSFTDLGLKEAKDLVEKAPVVLKKGLTKDEANPIIEKLKALGATVVLE
ncbi:uncharacterized protein [Euphorbia lathyris]|uniref:uncharacterized protein n=1 Tax=Euphorbia lathyris TaxID=212925 RepID=UPI003313FEC6